VVRVEHYVLPLLAAVELVAGLVVVSGVSYIVSYPIVLLILPALMDLRGDIYGSLSIRTVTALHLGLSRPTFRSKFVVMNLKAAVLISILASTVVAVVSMIVEWISWGEGLGVLLLPLSYSTTLLAFALVVPISLKTIFEAFKRGVSIEYLAAPIVSGISDVITPLLLFLFAAIVHYPLASILILLLSLLLILRCRKLDESSTKYVRENSVATMVVATLSGFGGLFYALNIRDPLVQRILLSAPGFNAVLGAFAGIVASSLSVRLQTVGEVGMGDLKGLCLRSGAQYLAAVMVLALPVLAYGGVLCFSAVLAASLAGFLVMLASTHFLTLFTFRHGLDPDNVVFPIMTTVGDLVGPALVIASYLALRSLLGA